jgi:hypothetical protein
VIGGRAETVTPLVDLLQYPDARAEVKAAAADALLTLDLGDAETGVPVLLLILRAEKPETRAAALTKLATFGKKAKAAFNPIIARLDDTDPGVRVAALRALAPFGSDAADTIPTVAALLDGKQPETVAVAAAETLGKLGPKAIGPLTKALEAKLPKDSLARVCEGLGGFGKDAQSAGPALLDALAKQPALSALAAEASNGVGTRRQPWAPDPVAYAVATIGGDKVAKQLTDWTAFESKTINGVKTRVATKGDVAMLWSILVLGSLDPNTLTDKVKEQVANQLDALARYAPTDPCKEAARAAQSRFPLKKRP